MMSKALDFFWHIFFPNKCMLCRTYVSYDQAMCSYCADNLPIIEHDICPACQKRECSCDKSIISRLICPFYYDNGVDNAVRDMKFNDNYVNAKKLSSFIAKRVIEEGVECDLIIPIPLYKSDFYARGYNQAELLAAELSRYLKKPMESGVLVKIAKTQKQHSLSLQERLINLNGAFSVADDKGIKGKRILLVDDVYTTGATMCEAARMLLDSGAQSIIAATAAKTRTNDFNETHT